jgi:hypothetical protein
MFLLRRKRSRAWRRKIKGMRSYFQAAATVFEAPREDEGIQRRQDKQPNVATAIVKTIQRDEP